MSSTSLYQMKDVYISIFRPDCITAVLMWDLPTEIQTHTIIITLRNLTMETEVVLHSKATPGQLILPFQLRRGHDFVVGVRAARIIEVDGCQCYIIEGRSRWCEFSAGNINVLKAYLVLI